ncbi:MAG: sugar ABC transporter permease [Bifidobacterium sp.]|uniref:carbohydrate ABC transporter permease n=1 Tax=Bifidobacterium sp. TaxID=41200 RepID=UPI0039E80018
MTRDDESGDGRSVQPGLAASNEEYDEKKLRGSRFRSIIAPYLYVAPAFVVFAAFLGWQLVQTAEYSLFDWDGLGASTFVGLSNYLETFQDPEIRSSFIHALVLTLFYAGIPVIVALILTVLISRSSKMKVMSFYRTVLFLPQVISSVVVATIWVSMYSQNGFINRILNALHLGGLTHAWLGDYSTALIAIGVVGTWTNMGLCLVLFLSGVGNIEPELFEAVRLDGANKWQEFFAITLPELRGQISVALTLTVISAFKTFDLVFVTTRGGPGNSTSVPAWEAYNRAFNTGQVGLASAVAVVLTVLIVIITWAIGRIDAKETA